MSIVFMTRYDNNNYSCRHQVDWERGGDVSFFENRERFKVWDDGRHIKAYGITFP